MLKNLFHFFDKIGHKSPKSGPRKNMQNIIHNQEIESRIYEEKTKTKTLFQSQKIADPVL